MSKGQLIFGKDDNKNASIQVLFPELNKMRKEKKNVCMWISISPNQQLLSAKYSKGWGTMSKPSSSWKEVTKD